jgi:hypothetical protein
VKILPNDHKFAVKKPRFSIPRPSKFYPNWDLWNENIPSGNPVLRDGKPNFG